MFERWSFSAMCPVRNWIAMEISSASNHLRGHERIAFHSFPFLYYVCMTLVQCCILNWGVELTKFVWLDLQETMFQYKLDSEWEKEIEKNGAVHELKLNTKPKDKQTNPFKDSQTRLRTVPIRKIAFKKTKKMIRTSQRWQKKLRRLNATPKINCVWELLVALSVGHCHENVTMFAFQCGNAFTTTKKISLRFISAHSQFQRGDEKSIPMMNCVFFTLDTSNFISHSMCVHSIKVTAQPISIEIRKCFELQLKTGIVLYAAFEQNSMCARPLWLLPSPTSFLNAIHKFRTNRNEFTSFPDEQFNQDCSIRLWRRVNERAGGRAHRNTHTLP